MTTFTSWDAELCHFGILGMKWGRRRFQNPDGSLTEAGKARYGNVESMSDEEINRAIARLDAEKRLKQARGEGRFRNAASAVAKAATRYMDYKKSESERKAAERANLREHIEKMKELETRNKEAEERTKEAAEKARAQQQMAEQEKSRAAKAKSEVRLYRTSAKRKEAKSTLKRLSKELSSGKKYKLIKKMLGDNKYRSSVELLLGANYDVKLSEARKAYILDPEQFRDESKMQVLNPADYGGQGESKKKKK